MIEFYWSLGRGIVQMDAENTYGSGFYEKLSSDLIDSIPNAKGFSPRNLRYMKRLFLFSRRISEILPQVVAKMKDAHLKDEYMIDKQPKSKIHPQVVGNSDSEILPQVVEKLFCLPWGHIRLLIDKCENNPQKALFYIQQTLEHNWSRAVLQNWLDTDLYERHGKAITNFFSALPSPQSDLAQELTKDPYSFDFLSITPRYDEKQLKDALLDNIQRFLMELGSGFSFVGREYRLLVGETEQFIDALFYNFQIHCFVVIEVKVTEFNPRDMGQLITYVSAVDGIMKKEVDQPTVGLLICKTKDNVLAKYATDAVKVPVGVSEYQISHFLNEGLRTSLPSTEELEEALSRKR
jgi:predicted nuclease of restriction endonuclease-like (RecB) superfamily